MGKTLHSKMMGSVSCALKWSKSYNVKIALTRTSSFHRSFFEK